MTQAGTPRQFTRNPFKWEVRKFRREFSADTDEVWLDECFVNVIYSVQVSIIHTDDYGRIDHLWVRRHDDKMPRSWNDLQSIKNELVQDGEQRLAVQVFPTKEMLVDEANMAHLWVFPVGFEFPFGLHADQRVRVDRGD